MTINAMNPIIPSVMLIVMFVLVDLG